MSPFSMISKKAYSLLEVVVALALLAMALAAFLHLWGVHQQLLFRRNTLDYDSLATLASDLLENAPAEGVYCYVSDDVSGAWILLPQPPDSGDYLEVRLSLLAESAFEAAFYRNHAGKSIGPLLILPFSYVPNAE